MNNIEYGVLGANGDTLFLTRPNHMILLDAEFPVDDALFHKTVSAAGKFGIPPSAPGITKLLVDRFASHDEIAKRAFAIYQSGRGGSAGENWVRAERELLGV